MKGAHIISKFSRSKTVVAVAIAAVLGSAFFATNYSMTKADDTVAIPLVAHRGYSDIYPENTLSAFAGAIACDAKYIEFDVQRTKDNQLVIFHDDDMLRICNNYHKISDYTYDELLEFDVGAYKGDEFVKERIPTFDQTLDLLAADDSTLIVELKEIRNDEGFAEDVYNHVLAKGMVDRVVFASFNYDYLTTLDGLDENVSTMYISTMSSPSIVETNPADYYNLNRKYLSARTVKTIHSVDAICFAYTAKTEKQILNMQSIGVDGVVSDGLNY